MKRNCHSLSLSFQRCPQLRKPYLYSIHASPITCVQAYDGCPKDLLQTFKNASSTNSAATSEVISDAVSKSKDSHDYITCILGMACYGWVYTSI